MARKIAPDGDRLVGLDIQDPIKTVISLETITPMFGGSAKAGYIDKTNPVRAASIRGHLRFWWRALFGTRYATTKDLFTAEEILWGSSEKPGLISLKVLEAERVQREVEPSDFGSGKLAKKTGPLEVYFLFPFIKSKTESAKPGAQKVSFTIELTYHAPPDQLEDLQKQVESTLRAWIALGGIGARTRRGLGALRATSNKERWLPSHVGTLGSWLGLSEKANTGAATAKPDFPVLAGAKAVFGRNLSDTVRSGSGVEVLRAWRELGKFWARFRKGHFTDDGTGYQPTAGTIWPDHYELLHLSSRGVSGNRQIEQAKPFWGLPIVYQDFQGRAFGGTLVAVAPNGSRMASPVILKPVAFANGEIRPMVLVLKAPEPRRIKISSKGKTIGEYVLRFPSGDVEPLKSLGASTPEDAVISAARKFGWNEEVVL